MRVLWCMYECVKCWRLFFLDGGGGTGRHNGGWDRGLDLGTLLLGNKS